MSRPRFIERGPRRSPAAGAKGPSRTETRPTNAGSAPATPESALGRLLREIDREPFDAYRRLLGRYPLGEFWVTVDRVPPDPFAGAARVRISIDRSKGSLPDELVATRAGCLAVEDLLTRDAASALARQQDTAENAPPGIGRIWLDPPGAAMIDRSTCRIGEKEIELRLWIDLPANGGWVRGLKAADLFEGPLTRLAMSTLVFSSRRLAEARRAVDASNDHAWMQEELARRGLVAFIADGSVLARAPGRGDGPMRASQASAFEAPQERALSLLLPHAGALRGMGIPAGVTVVAGGAFQGKSTLLSAVASGVHPHPPGDGRERVATNPAAVEIRREESRPIQRADLSAFVRTLPSGSRGADITLERAAGAVAQAATLVDAVEAGAKLLLLDENHFDAGWWTRDARMNRLVPSATDPLISPVERLRELYDSFGISTIVVTRGSSGYLDVADTVLLMENYKARDMTAAAMQLAAAPRSTKPKEEAAALGFPAKREPYVPAAPAHSAPALARGRHEIRVGDEVLDLRALAQIVEVGQTRTLALLLRIAASLMKDGRDFASVLDELEAILDRGLESLDAEHRQDLSRPRRFEIAAVLNRWSALRVRRAGR